MNILMCVPNISEGKNLKVVEQVMEEIRRVADVKVQDVSSDPDHNRSVLTYLGEPEAVLKATRAMAKKTFELIDMSKHHGSHPRMGAVDVVPFIPIRGVETKEAVEIARRFGKFVGEQGVPVYYYEDAATRPERKSLTDIRKGEYEALPEKLKSPAWAPDEGPAVFNPKSGGLVTGARFPLVAFNVNLRTENLEIAQKIAKAVRQINGGYRFVRAIGLSLEDQKMVQVSMNLTHYRKTPIPRVFETIRSEAARYGVNVAGTELVGPVPLGALEEVLKHYLQVHDFSMDQIIENALIE
ncbi:MAG: glutamate formimidoyltransferase [Deltaproteobacteria bacterium]|nr:MAG: glutamate formimidoyltransferase [Deltaproteobacteria bacterium]